MKRVLIVAAGLLLNGCERNLPEAPVSASASAPSSRAAALPLIQDAIARQVPVFEGRWNANMMGQICQLASGESDARSFADYFIRRGVDVKSLATRDSGFAFIARADVASAKVACAAWLISSQLAPVEAWGAAIDSSDALARKLAPMTPLVDQTINLLSRLASDTTRRAYPSEQEYRQAVESALIHAAPAYVNATLNGRFIPENYRRPGSRDSLYNYRLNGVQTEVMLNGVMWLGAGKIKGESYAVTLTGLAVQP